MTAVQGRLTALENASKGVVVTAWQSYTPAMTAWVTGTTIGNQTTTGKYRRVGDSVEVRIYTVFSAAPNSGTTLYLWSLPPGLTIDFAKTAAGGPGELLGYGEASLNSATTVIGVYARTASAVSLFDIGNPYYVNDNSPYAFAANSDLIFDFTFPVVGWSATQ
jgi:hypothetical protein